MSCMTAKTLQRRLQVAFRVDQEVRGDHDLLAHGQSVEDLDPIATAATQGGWRVDAVAATQDAAGVIDALTRHLDQENA